MLIEKSTIEKMITDKIQTGKRKFGEDFEICIVEILSLQRMLIPETAAQQKVQSRIIPLSEWNKYHVYPTVRALRNYYTERDKNDFESCIEYGGNNQGRILINENKFFAWQESRKKLKCLSSC